MTKKALRVFRGAKRRLQYVGSIGDVQIYDDYGHHPNEIAATLRAVRSIFPGHRLIAIFQPHRYTRTAAMFGDFAKVLPLADEVFLLPIYPADEEQTDGVSSVLIADAMECEGHACHFCQNMKDVQKQITALVRSGMYFDHRCREVCFSAETLASVTGGSLRECNGRRCLSASSAPSFKK